MRANPRRRRRIGSLADLKRSLWVAICYNRDVIEAADLSHEVRQRASNALSQAALAYLRVTEVADIEGKIQQMERAMDGHHAL